MPGRSPGNVRAACELLADLLAAWTGTSWRRMDRSVVNYEYTCRARWPCLTSPKGHGCAGKTHPVASRCRIDLGQGEVASQVDLGQPEDVPLSEGRDRAATVRSRGG